MDDLHNIPQLLDRDITSCISQLAARAVELGENNTAIVLYTLAGCRVIGADGLLASVAKEHAEMMNDIMKKIKDSKNPPSPPTSL